MSEETILTYLVWCVLGVGIPAVILQELLCARLHRRHVEKWLDLGKPGYRNVSGWAAWSVRLTDFVRNKRYLGLQDPMVDRLALSLRFLGPTFAVLAWLVIAFLILLGFRDLLI